jgi:hypothetical protein
MIHTYVHRFPNGAIATATLRVEPPGFEIEWQGRPSKAVLAEYLEWRKTILADFTQRTGKRVLVVNLV